MEGLKELLKELILIDSSTVEGANQAVEFCCHWLRERKLEVTIMENNGFKMLICEIGQGDKTIIFNGHVDVVSGKREQFIPVERDGRMYGRGTADMKAGVAAMMCAMAEIRTARLGVKIQLQIVSDEEIGGLNCTGYLVDNGYTGDFVICSEPTQLGIALQAKGTLKLDIELKGKPAHGSRPWEGENAIVKAFEVYNKMIELPFTKQSSEFYPFPSINLAKIKGGEIYNKVPDECVLSFDIRYLPGQKVEDVIRQIESVTDGKVKVIMSGAPVQTSKDDPFIQMLKPVVEKQTGSDAVFFGQHGSADTLFFSAHGIPAIEFGPKGGNWHGDDEYIDLASVLVYKQMLIDFALDFK
ncbi:M20 family metallopeptidase [Bacillus sp. T33-2]|uniref:M20 family metallopeptidase n=1 Tax=Bacillus sp. T33-2 TaxID=2054168 RepID=UPI000C75FC53|nr:M20/M25/M40 family metallo-hydrolase [Bacillus sp. T33-2]PLR96063.1 succinyl-diaminopimelate desuccinylase [Bacillus sp. T33-2]